jgi:hypothetical protein
MLLRKLLFISVFFVIVSSGEVFADPVSKEHGHKTPHGGVVQEAEGMHVEFLLNKSGESKIYLYDKAMKPLAQTGLQAKLTVKGHDGVQHSRDLKPAGNPKESNLLTGEAIRGLSDWDTAVVSLKIKDRWTHFRFSHH